MRRPVALAVLALSLAAPLHRADAQQGVPDRWSVAPASDDPDCGGECYVPPTAWVATADGAVSFGIQCEGMMVLGDDVLTSDFDLPFEAVTLAVDGVVDDRFDVHFGLNDIFIAQFGRDVRPEWPARRARFEAGANLVLTPETGAPPLAFSLIGLGPALQALDTLCAAEAERWAHGSDEGK